MADQGLLFAPKYSLELSQNFCLASQLYFLRNPNWLVFPVYLRSKETAPINLVIYLKSDKSWASPFGLKSLEVSFNFSFLQNYKTAISH